MEEDGVEAAGDDVSEARAYMVLAGEVSSSNSSRCRVWSHCSNCQLVGKEERISRNDEVRELSFCLWCVHESRKPERE